MGEFDLSIVEDKKPNDWDHLRHDMAQCSDCGWTGPISECEMYEDSEGWEYPNSRYTVICCPLCALYESEGCIEYTWSSIEAAIEGAYMDTLDYDSVK